MKKIIVLVVALLLSGCAHMMDGDSQTINLKTSDSKRVKIKLKNDGKESVYTIPSKVKVKKSQNDIIITTVATECIIPTTTIIPSKIDEWLYANAANLGIGLIEDLKGPAWKYDDVYTVKVKRDEACINKAKKLNEEILNLHQ